MRVHHCLMVLSSACLAFASGSRPRRGAEQDFWSGQSVGGVGGFMPGDTVVDIPVNDVPLGPDHDLDKIQVISSAITVLPRKKGARRTVRALRARREAVQSFRRPRQYQFVTNKLDRLPPPPIVRVYPPVDRSERLYDRDRDFRKSKRRIIYYATLPEIVRPPVAWYNQRGDYNYDPRQAGGYPAPSSLSYAAAPPPTRYPSSADNEITRVQSNIIDVTNSRYTDGYSSSPSLTPKFTIIDVEPPYNFPGYRDRPQSYEMNPRLNYNANRYYGDFRTPPYRDQRFPENQYYRPEPSLEPVKLNIPTTASDYSSSHSSSSTPAPAASSSSAAPDATATNSTRFLPDALPASLRSLALTRSRFA